MKNKKSERKKFLGGVSKTKRGFEKIDFPDHSDTECCLQQSSTIIDHAEPGASALWLGVENANPIIMATDAATFGIKTNETSGWIPYPVPPAVLLSTRMHLTHSQVEALIGHLQNWLDTGSLQ